jgi:ADP-ribose pyrophosphatase
MTDDSDGPFEQLIERRTVFRGRPFAVHVDRVRRPDGTAAVRNIVDHPGSVVLIARDGPAVLLVRQYRQAVGRVLLELPAGTCEPGEPEAETARRELAEEVGMQARSWTLLARLLVSPGYVTETMAFYLAEELTPAAATPDDDEDLEPVHLPWEEAVARARAAGFDDLKTIAGLLLADEVVRRS